GELRAGQQVMNLDNITVDVRQDCRRAADGHEPEGQKMQKQRAEVEAVHQSRSLQAAKTAQGARAPRIHKSGQRITPTPAKASRPKIHGRQCRGSTIANLTTVASSSPAATFDMPASACCTC